jgi:hypothetical protein
VSPVSAEKLASAAKSDFEQLEVLALNRNFSLIIKSMVYIARLVAQSRAIMFFCALWTEATNHAGNWDLVGRIIHSTESLSITSEGPDDDQIVLQPILFLLSF